MFSLLTLNEVEQWKEEDPHYVDEVPVKSEVFKGSMISAKILAFHGVGEQVHSHAHSRENVNSVSSGCYEVTGGWERIALEDAFSA